MSEIKDGGPAFPTGHSDEQIPGDGLSLRDYFAAKALQGAIHHRGFTTVDYNRNMDAKDAYAYADAMLRARGQS